MLPTQYTEVPIQGLDERSDPQRVQPGKLTLAYNVEFNEDGAINKRRGYDRTQLTEVFNAAVDELFLHCGVHADELLVFGYDYLYALASQNASIPTGKAFVRRCPLPRCTLTYQDVSVTTAPSTLAPPG